ncbi:MULTISPECIES: CaiB/BaiF CoA-transferase family protein [unclassified Parafrankia]|uniref:CaiB/BaiF CoA transferase family protein n=1 Tax=unclassified Parafrankia TaxID=2994368 RepID=UPI000DA50238|nr:MULTISPECIES: CoA transferase [unclassified Parafrankia]TCJ32610.1 CoA transferase [Parafrankia sp. BMG5.11]CAI7976483.1 L-carnitine dehydratase/bile acid-inducible protein F [Frankia sp. Hr75.2]SQD99144.1 L-carnitine dehydratase/bile acid-inducible protein F [Parafrankia sp. Ea1.12]
MTSVMQGVRILEVAEHTFVPAASALLSDLGADVIKVEHVVRGDAMRGLESTGMAAVGGGVHALLEHSNRGKRSIGLDLTSADGLDLLYRIAATADVFLTNKLPSVRAKLRIGLDEIRAANPNIIYARGTGQGERGPDADKGAYDALAFWARAGVAVGTTRPEYDGLNPPPPGPGFGDSIGAVTIAGGIMGALFHRERTGEATTVDISLLNTGMWAMGQAIALSLLLKRPWQAPPVEDMSRNPLVATYGTKDGRGLMLCCLQAGRYWAELCAVIGRPELATDPLFADHGSLMANHRQVAAHLTLAFAERPVDEWRRRLEPFSGQWAVVQDTLEAAADPQTAANGYLQPCESATGAPFELVAAPMQYNEQPAAAGRAPGFNEHGDEILADIGLDMEAVIDLRIRGVVA